jgi:hypothetical protein
MTAGKTASNQSLRVKPWPGGNIKQRRAGMPKEEKKFLHDVDYTTSMDEQGNMEMEEEVNDQEEKRHFRR